MNTATLGFEPSKYQKNVFDFVQNGEGNLFIDALAGSGKSTTIISVGNLLNQQGTKGDDILFLAFNKDIVDALKEKVGEKFTCKTLNSLGHNVLKMKIKNKLVLNNNKYRDFINDILTPIIDPLSLYDCTMAIVNILGKCMADLISSTDIDGIQGIINHYGIDLPNDLNDKLDLVFKSIHLSMEWGKKTAREKGIISYDDQIWLPCEFGWSSEPYSWVLVDEAQDLSKAKLKLALSSLSLNGRFIAVGDRNQSIMAFAGADSRSVDNIILSTKATVLPLSICYRCPKTIVELAQEIVPSIEYKENAEDGIISSIKDEDFINHVKPGAFVMCRLTSPIVSLAIRLISNKIGAKVKGREIGMQIKKTMQEIAGKKSKSLTDFYPLKDAYVLSKRALIQSKKDHEQILQNFDDKVMCVEVIFDAYNPKNLFEFNQSVDSLFSDENSVVTLSTVHKAKGLEYDDVYIYNPNLLPLVRKNQKDWEYEQEMNLKYVAITRSKKSLTFIEVKRKK